MCITLNIFIQDIGFYISIDKPWTFVGFLASLFNFFPFMGTIYFVFINYFFHTMLQLGYILVTCPSMVSMWHVLDTLVYCSICRFLVSYFFTYSWGSPSQHRSRSYDSKERWKLSIRIINLWHIKKISKANSMEMIFMEEKVN